MGFRGRVRISNVISRNKIISVIKNMYIYTSRNGSHTNDLTSQLDSRLISL
jgi:hypothetical protein